MYCIRFRRVVAAEFSRAVSTHGKAGWHYPNLCTNSAREVGRQNKAWGEARREPQESIKWNEQAHEVGDRPF